VSQMRKVDRTEAVKALEKRVEETDRQRQKEIRAARLVRSSVDVEWVAETENENDIIGSYGMAGKLGSVDGRWDSVMSHLLHEGETTGRVESNRSVKKEHTRSENSVGRAEKTEDDEQDCGRQYVEAEPKHLLVDKES
jgi:hypothetical protein